YLEALKLNPQSELILTDLGLAYELQGRSDKAIELYQRILAMNPNSVPVRRRLGSLYVGQKKLDDALAQFQEMEKLDADPREPRTKIGLIYLEKGDPERASTEFNLVIAAEPENWRVRYYLGSVYAERKEAERALEEFGKIPPDSEYYVDARIQRAYLLEKSGRLPDAVRETEGALKTKPDNPELMGYLAALYREKKDLKAAIAILEKVVQRYPDNDRYR